MAERAPRVVAELGRPETPEETAARKAESSRIYRSSQSTRNLIAALIVTVAIVAVIIFAVPRGTPPERAPIDVAAVAAQSESAEGRTVIAPETPDGWRVNAAAVEPGTPRVWKIVYAPLPAAGFVNIAQAFDPDATWASRVLGGAAATETVTIDGVVWDSYDIVNRDAAGNVSAALSTNVGDDTVLVYGAVSDDTLERAARAAVPQIRELAEETP